MQKVDKRLNTSVLCEFCVWLRSLAILPLKWCTTSGCALQHSTDTFVCHCRKWERCFETGVWLDPTSHLRDPEKQKSNLLQCKLYPGKWNKIKLPLKGTEWKCNHKHIKCKQTYSPLTAETVVCRTGFTGLNTEKNLLIKHLGGSSRFWTLKLHFNLISELLSSTTHVSNGSEYTVHVFKSIDIICKVLSSWIATLRKTKVGNSFIQ